MAIEEIAFSEWTKWAQRYNLRTARKPGIYLLGEFEEQPEGEAQYLDQNTILIAITYSKRKGIIGRLEEFQQCVRSRDITPCSEGPTYAKRCENMGKNPFEDLYVAIMPVDIKETKERRTELMETKRILLDGYQTQRGRYPAMNKKRG